ncbi:MAG TPA: TMEM175 family protein [Amycolatopsis sp.]|nr:TMEM175 family protein [Amycolatopsis sp.]
MPSGKGSPDRLVFFSDAVVAIAITLLILPLTEAVPAALEHHLSAPELISENAGKIYSFLLSFVVIARLWGLHHHLFEQVKAYSRPLLYANLAWLLSIVALPFPTEITSLYPAGQFEAALYIGTIFASSLCQAAMVLVIRGDPDLREADSDPVTRPLFDILLTTGTLALAFAVAALVPGAGYYPLLLLLVPPMLDRIRRARTTAT